MDKGARVHFHAESGLIIDKEGSFQINGEVSGTEALENEVIFEGDRLEPGFADVAGQWGAVISLSETNTNIINHLTLKNATIGLLLQRVDPTTSGSPKLTINNSQIYNCLAFGILGQKAQITSENLVANYCGTASVALTLGGDSHFKHATIANYFNAFNQVPLLINNYADIGDTRFVTSAAATFENCVIYGSNNISLSLERIDPEDPSVTFNATFNNCLIKLYDTTNQLEDNELYPFDENQPALATYNAKTMELLAENSGDAKPDFADPADNDLHLGEDSAEIQNAGLNLGVTVDVEGRPRDNEPDLGAYEYVPAD